MIKYIHAQIEEIRRSRVLGLFGVFLALTHLVTWFFWGPWRSSFVKVLSERTAICWSYFPDCNALRPLSESFVSGLLYFYLFLGVATLVAVIAKKWRAFWWLLLIAVIVKWAMISLDYRFMGNYHYMPLVLSLVYLLVPSKKNLLPFFLISFYVAAGLLKFTPEWYSGSTLLRPAFIQGKLLEWALVYVIYLELLFVWGLVSSKQWLRWIVFIQLVLFHIFSWHIVGFFYPTIMFCLLAFFPLLWLLPEKQDSKSWPKAGVLALALFWCAQMVPFIFYKNSAVSGEGRILSLNMLDAWTVCDATALVKMNKQQMLIPVKAKNFGVRIQCDPAVYIALLREECEKWRKTDGFVDMDFDLQSMLRTETTASTVMSVRNACSRPPRLSILGSVVQ